MWVIETVSDHAVLLHMYYVKELTHGGKNYRTTDRIANAMTFGSELEAQAVIDFILPQKPYYPCCKYRVVKRLKG